MSNWIMSQRDNIVETPRNFTWRSIDSITPETRKLLSLLQPHFHDIALFCWHPNIKRAQWTEYTPPQNLISRGNDTSHYNQRMTINQSLIALRPDNEKSKDRDGFDLIRAAIEQVPYMKFSCGNGGSQDGKECVQVQIHFSSKTIQASYREKDFYTAGAYSFDGKEWKVLLSSELDTTGDTKKEVQHHISLLEKYFLIHKEVEETLIGSGVNGSLRIKFHEVDFLYIRVEKAELPMRYSFRSLSFFGVGQSSRDIVSNNFTDLMRKLHENIPFLLNVNSIFEKNGDDFEKSFSEIITEKRGVLAGKTFGF